MANALQSHLEVKEDQLRRGLTDPFELELDIVGPTPGFMVSSSLAAKELHLSAYDAAYVQLAREIAVPLATADAKLAQQARKVVEVELLSDLSSHAV